MIDLYFWFDKSTKRKATLVEFCEFCDHEFRRILKHVNSRWLSLETANLRTLKMFIPLESYVKSTGK